MKKTAGSTTTSAKSGKGTTTDNGTASQKKRTADMSTPSSSKKRKSDKASPASSETEAPLKQRLRSATKPQPAGQQVPLTKQEKAQRKKDRKAAAKRKQQGGSPGTPPPSKKQSLSKKSQRKAYRTVFQSFVRDMIILMRGVWGEKSRPQPNELPPITPWPDLVAFYELQGKCSPTEVSAVLQCVEHCLDWQGKVSNGDKPVLRSEMFLKLAVEMYDHNDLNMKDKEFPVQHTIATFAIRCCSQQLALRYGLRVPSFTLAEARNMKLEAVCSFRLKEQVTSDRVDDKALRGVFDYLGGRRMQLLKARVNDAALLYLQEESCPPLLVKETFWFTCFLLGDLFNRMSFQELVALSVYITALCEHVHSVARHSGSTPLSRAVLGDRDGIRMRRMKNVPVDYIDLFRSLVERLEVEEARAAEPSVAPEAPAPQPIKTIASPRALATAKAFGTPSPRKAVPSAAPAATHSALISSVPKRQSPFASTLSLRVPKSQAPPTLSSSVSKHQAPVAGSNNAMELRSDANEGSNDAMEVGSDAMEVSNDATEVSNDAIEMGSDATEVKSNAKESKLIIDVSDSSDDDGSRRYSRSHVSLVYRVGFSRARQR